MERFIPRTKTTAFAGAILAVMLALPGLARAQTPPKPESDELGPPPEQLVEDAIKKIEDGDLAQAADLIRKAKVKNSNLNKLKLAEGLFAAAFVRQGQGPDAISHLEAYNKTSEGQADYHGFLTVGRLYRDSGLYPQAIFALEKAKKLAPEKDPKTGRHLQAEAAIDLANLYLQRKRSKDALEVAKEAQKFSDDVRVQLGLAQVAVQAEDSETAAKSCDQAIKLLLEALRNDPLKRETYQQLGSAYMLRKELIQREIKEKPDAALSYYKLAVNARNVAEIQKFLTLLDARENVGQALTKEPANLECLLFAAQLEAELGAVDEARQHIDEILKIKPEHSEALELRERLQSGAGGFKAR